MTGMRRTVPLLIACACFAQLSSFACAEDPPTRPTLVGFAALPPDTFTAGPRSGQFIKDPVPINGRRLPFEGQPVQGVSDIVRTRQPGEYLALSDNGFGAKANSADYLLCVYRVRPSFKEPHGKGGDGTVAAEVAFRLRDPDRHVKWPIVADGTTYPGSDVPVPAEVRDGRLLTGADFDVESMVEVDGTFWLGDEFGPFLLHVDATGKLLEPPYELPGEGLHSPDHPTNDPAAALIARSSGFEATVLFPRVPSGSLMVQPILEKPLKGESTLRVYGLEIRPGNRRVPPGEKFPHYGPFHGTYPLPDTAKAVGAAVTLPNVGIPSAYVFIERDDGEGDAARHKVITLAREVVPRHEGRLDRTPLVDLLDVDDPHDLDGDGSTKFRFPFWTIESVLVVDDRTLLVVNDNNYPFSAGRTKGQPEATEFILIRLPRPLGER
jgi:hypothetical protein